MGYTDAIRVLCVGGNGDPALAEVSAAGTITPVQANSIVDAVNLVEGRDFDAVVVGPTVGTDPVAVVSRLRSQGSATPIVVAGDPSHPDEVIDVINAGATRYVRLSDTKADLTGQVAHLATDHRVDASLDRYRDLNQAIWASTEAAVRARDRDGIEAAVHRRLARTDLVDSVWVARVRTDDGFLSIRQPYESTLNRSQVAALLGDTAPEQIEAAVADGDVRSVSVGGDGDVAVARTAVIVPLSNGRDGNGVVLFTVASAGIDSADRDALGRFGRVIGRLLSLARNGLEPVERTEAVLQLVSHEIRNPLTTAMSGLQIAREAGEASAFDRVERSLEEIERTVSTLTTLFNEEGVGQTFAKRFEETALRAWEQVATPVSNLELREIGTIEADHDLLERLLVNLFRNSIQFTEGDVTVTVGRTDGGFFVADTGPGIPAADRESVFEWGFSTRDAGFGVGLALVREIVDFHGWSIDLVESPAGGARFEVTGVGLPTEADHPENGSDRVAEDDTSNSG